MLTKIDGEWPSSQHSLKFRKRFLNWPIFVRRWRMTCERSEFVTNAYEDTANVAKFERLPFVSTFASIFATVWDQHNQAPQALSSSSTSLVLLGWIWLGLLRLSARRDERNVHSSSQQDRLDRFPYAATLPLASPCDTADAGPCSTPSRW